MPHVSRKQIADIASEYDNGVVPLEEVVGSGGNNAIFGNIYGQLPEFDYLAMRATYPSSIEEVYEKLDNFEPLNSQVRRDLSNGFIIDENGHLVRLTRWEHRDIIERMRATLEERTNMRKRFLREDSMDYEYLQVYTLS